MVLATSLINVYFICMNMALYTLIGHAMESHAIPYKCAVVLKIRFKWNTLYVIKQSSRRRCCRSKRFAFIYCFKYGCLAGWCGCWGIFSSNDASGDVDNMTKSKTWNLKMSGNALIANQRFILSHVFAGSTWTTLEYNGSNGNMKFTWEWWKSSNANSWICTLLSPHSYRGELKWSDCVYEHSSRKLLSVWNNRTLLHPLFSAKKYAIDEQQQNEKLSPI